MVPRRSVLFSAEELLFCIIASSIFCFVNNKEQSVKKIIKNYKGFTLMELLVVIIIIGVLSAIAVPLYKRATIKSRFSTVMPMAKAIADAQEVYYQGRQQYALSQDELDVTPVNAARTEATLSTSAEKNMYSYVAANRTDIPGARYMVYQKYSPRFASNIHCEAEDDDEEATQLCRDGLHGTSLGGSTQEGWTAYLLEGNVNEATDYFPKECDGSGVQDCECGELVGVCNERTGEWDYGSAYCPVKPDATQNCTSGNAQMTRDVTCDDGEWQTGEWDESACKPPFTGNQGYYNRTQQAKEYAQYWADRIEEYYNQHGYYPSNGWQGYANQLRMYDWGTCYFNEGTPKAVYCNVDYLGRSGSAGGIGIVYEHSSSHGGDMYCWSRTTEPMDEVCRYEAGNGYSAGNRSYL